MFNIEKAHDMQKQYCSKLGQPYFAPRNGICPNCHQNIYEEVRHVVKSNTSTTYQYTGISVETASSFLITECPHCHINFR